MTHNFYKSYHCQLYRFRISDLPELPGAELYPTIELIDRLHPPCGRELEFPVPVAFTQEELQAALAGRLVTKVVYIERPQQATPERGTNAERAFLAGPAASYISGHNLVVDGALSRVCV